MDPAQAAKCAHKSQAATQAPLRSFVTPTPTTQPPLHGTLAHGQGTVAVLQLNPDSARPYGNDPTGKDAGSSPETLVVGRARGEQRADGTYHGHITIAALAGNEILGVDTNPGETKAGPLSALQQQVLDALCTGSSNQICLKAVVANSSTSATGSTNHFETAHATLGGPTGIDVGAASSDGNITQANGCQTATGASNVASVKLSTAFTADAVQSNTTSNAGTCGSAAPQTNTSKVINLAGSGLPIPAAGCANGTANTVTDIPMLLTLVCNADDTQPGGAGTPQTTAPYGVREALDAFLLASAGLPPLIPASSAAKLTTGASESHAIAPAPVGPTGPTGATGTTNNGGSCNVGGDNDCATSNPNGPSLPEGGAVDKARDCAEGVENTPACPGKKGTGPSAGGRCNTGGDNDCVTGAGPFGPKLAEGGPTDRARDCAEGVTSEGKQSCVAGPARANARSTLPFTG
ncbi:MAG: hypothetical protein NVSMB51_00910 [Solirubrobacteraceae bacterium]